jgi:hypothetical protein
MLFFLLLTLNFGSLLKEMKNKHSPPNSISSDGTKQTFPTLIKYFRFIVEERHQKRIFKELEIINETWCPVSSRYFEL